MPNVAYVREEIQAMLPKWDVVRDCLSGERQVKMKQTKYLPMPNPNNKSPENKKRYEQYLMRASFYPVTGSTVEGLLGQVFDVDPIVEVPEEIDMFKTDVTGGGVGLAQAASKTLAEVLAYGRHGLLVDYPDLEAPTREDVQLGYARPIIAQYSPESIINWRTKTKGAKTVLTMVVFSEMYVTKDDGFEIEHGYQYRVCRCDETTGDEYQVEIWRSEGKNFIISQTYFPKDARGQSLKFIPFTFVGSMNNDPFPDHPPMYGIAELNIKHYRNSADYEDSCYMVGQPTPVFTGLKKDWVDQVLKGTVELGSRGAVPLPTGATATLLQAAPNSMIKEAMDQKENQMVALGAQLIQPQNVSRTLGEAKMDKNTQTSVLAKCAQNVSKAYTQAFAWSGMFINGEEYDQNEVYLQLSTTFAITKLSPQEQLQLIANWQAGAITWNEMRAQLRMSGVATEDDEDAKAQIDEESAQRAALALDAINEQIVKQNNDPNNPDQPAE